MIQRIIQTKLEEALPGCQVHVVDLTGTQDHFQVVVVSALFEDKTLIEQHRMVYAPFDQEMQAGTIHAFSVKTMTPALWEKRKGK